ncbi:hypothetical protein PhCBS80983_g04598 [Powellomyces hirtus]|uniref:SCD domain-containing protein n=1 Tax=Powellomyces hirtus TaxID=109895 RepID=A0A507DYB1_9FUNG|nr:hypothetical protein PhCBS80983_g04598 [Powellomyces hirtus]
MSDIEDSMKQSATQSTEEANSGSQPRRSNRARRSTSEKSVEAVAAPPTEKKARGRGRPKKTAVPAVEDAAEPEADSGNEDVDSEEHDSDGEDDKNESDNENQSNNEHSDASSDATDEEPLTSKRRVSAAKARKASTLAKRKAASEENGKSMATPKKRTAKKKVVAPAEGTSLFEIVQNHNEAIEAQISDWMAEYTENKVVAMVDLVNFLIRSSGCSGQIEASAFEDQEYITERLTELQSQIEPQKQQDYPIVAKGRGRSGNKFRKHFADFWVKWISRLRHGILFQDDGWCFEALIVWLVAMSSSVFRPFRHTATSAALALMSGFCDIAKQIHNEKTIANRQLGTEQKKTGARITPKQKQLEERAEQLQEKMTKLKTCMNDIFDSVFVHRYRDSDPVIRTECLGELGMWILKFPEIYLDPSYLRYLGWMLSDKIATVRLEALRSLSRLYAVGSMISGLRAFTERFRPRLLQMALREKDTSVRAEAVHLVALIAGAGLLEDADNNSLMPLIFDEDLKIRGLVAKLVVEVWKEEHVQAISDELRTSSTEGNTTKQQWIDTKCLCKMLVGFAKILRDAPKSEPVPQPEAPQPAIPSQSQTQTQSLFAPDDSSLANDAEDAEEDLNEEEVEERDQILKERAQLVSWVIKDDAAADTAIGFGQVEAAVSALWDHVEVLRDWQSMCEYLAFDMSSNARELDPESQDSDVHSAMRLSDDEETCLIYIINAAIALYLSSEMEAADQKKSKPPKAEDARSEVTRGLIKYLPKLINKYSHEYTGAGQRRAAEIAILIRNVDVGMYLEMRMLKAYDALFDDVKRMFIKHSDREVLTECAQTLRFLTGKPVSSEMAADSQWSLPLAADTSATSLHATSLAKIEELADEVIGTQLAATLKQLQSATEEGLDIDADVIFSLRNSLRRLNQLWKVVDLGGMGSTIKAGDETEWNGLFELLHEVLNVSLTAVTKRQGREVADASDDNIGGVLDDIIETTLHVMCLDVVWVLSKGYMQATQRKSNASADALDKTDAMEVDGEAEANVKNSTNPNQEEIDGLLETFIDKSDRLATIAEAIVAGDDTEWINFSIGVKLTAFQILTYLYLMSNGDAAHLFPHIVKSPPDDVQAASVELLEKVVVAVSYTCRSSPASIESTSMDFTKLTRDQLEEVRFQVSKLIAELGRLINSELYDHQHSILLLKYYGIHDADALTNMLLTPFGTIWDGVAEVTLNRVFVTRMQQATKAVLDHDAEERKQNRLKAFKSTVTSLTDVLFEGLSQSTHMYLVSKVGTIDPALTLAKAVVALLKTWLPLVKASDDLKITHGIIVESLLNLLQRGGDEMVHRVEQWAVVHGNKESSDDMQFTRPKDVRKTLNEVNEAWKVWGAIGGTVQQIVHELGMLKRNRDDDEEETIDNVEDVVEHVSQMLMHNGHKPVETEKDWAGYWTFVKALQKGDSTVRRRGRKAKAIASRDVSPAPAAAKRKRGRPTKTAKADGETPAKKTPGKRGRPKKVRTEEDEDRDESPPATPVPTRRSSRAAASAKKTYQEVEEEDAEEEEAALVSSDAEENGDEERAANEGTPVPTRRPVSNPITPLATYKRRNKATPIAKSASKSSSAGGAGSDDDAVTPKRKGRGRPRKVSAKATTTKATSKSSVESAVDDEEEMVAGDGGPVQSTLTKGAAAKPARGVKRGRREAKTPPPRGTRALAAAAAARQKDADGGSQDESDEEEEQVDKENTRESSEELGFVSSPEVMVPKKRIRM